MMTLAIFKPSPARAWAERAFAAVNAAARRPELYGAGRVADTADMRFEMLVLHATPAFLRLKAALAADPATERMGDAFADRFFKSIDDSLREMGVGVLTVPRRMKKLARDVYGRIQAYEAGLAGDDAALVAAINRNVFNGEERPQAPALARRLRACVAAFADRPPDALADPAAWPAPDA